MSYIYKNSLVRYNWHGESKIDSSQGKVEDNMLRPYVGVACVRDRSQILTLIGLALSLKTDEQRRVVGLGYQISDKTLDGKPNKYPLVCPPVDDLSEWLSQSIIQPQGNDNFEHHLHWSTNIPPVVNDTRIVKIGELFGPYIQRLQINHPWPDPEVLWWWHELYPQHQLIVSINNESLAQEENDPQRVAKRFLAYQGLPVAAFFDLSGGQGKALDFDQAIAYLEPIARGKMNGNVHIAVAGGLGPDRLAIVDQIQDKLGGYISFDAQSKLYGTHGGLDLSRAEQFLRQGLSI